MSGMKRVHTAASLSEAETLKAYLYRRGIDSVLEAEEVSGPPPSISIMVLESDLARAGDVLRESLHPDPASLRARRRRRRIELVLFLLFAAAAAWFLLPPPAAQERQTRDDLYESLERRARALETVDPPSVDAAALCAELGEGLGAEGDALRKRMEAAVDFKALSEAWLEAWLTADPDWATQAGQNDRRELTRYDVRSRRGRLLIDALALQRFRALPRRVGTVEADLFERQLEGSMIEHLLSGPELTDPRVALWGAIACDALLGLDPIPFEVLDARLRGVPEVVEEVRAGLGEVPRLWIDVALEDLGGVLTFLEELERDHGRELGSAARLAADALRRYQSFLQDRRRTAGEVTDRDPRRARFLVGPYQFCDRTPAQTAAILIEEAYASADRWGELTRTAGKSLPQPRDMTWDAYLASCERAVDRARNFSRGLGLQDFPAGETLVVCPTPAYVRSSVPSAALVVPFLGKEARGSLYLTPWDGSAQGAMPVRRGELFLTAVHEAYPGHHLQDAITRRDSHWMLRLYGSSELVEGWAWHVERLALRAEYANDPATQADWHSRNSHLAWQCVMELCLEAGAIDEDRAIEFLTVCEGLEPPVARAMVANATLYPLYSLGYIVGERDVRRLEGDMEARQGSAFRAAEFYQRLMRFGRTPVQRVRREIYGK